MARKNIILFIFGIGLSLLLTIWFLRILFKPAAKNIKNNTGSLATVLSNTNSDKKQPPFDEEKIIRTQEEIRIEYEKNISVLLETTRLTEGSISEILAQTEASFFDIFVPNDKRDLHIQTLLEIQKLKREETFNGAEELKIRLIPLLEALLKK